MRASLSPPTAPSPAQRLRLVASDVTRNYGANHSENTATTSSVSCADRSVNANKTIVQTAGNEVRIICGSSGIKMTPNSIEIVTTNLTLNGSAVVEVAGGEITSAASGNHRVEGGMVKINS